jgi:hypothetical protein
MEVSKFQKFETVTLNRSQINGAEYNPRKISDDAKRKLKRNIERVGLLDTIVINKNTMNIVSGHQRISVLDTLERKKDYNITVAMVDLTEKEEKEQNVFFNNTKAQGEYDADLLKDVLIDIDYENTGLDINDIAILGIDSSIFEEQIDAPSITDITSINRDIINAGKERHEKRKGMISQAHEANKDRSDTFIILTFNSLQNKESFNLRFGFQKNEKYINGEVFSEMIERTE